MNAQHTPGPWQLSADGQRILDAHGEAVIADVHGAACPDQPGHANARLIASAPELLAALRQIQTLANFSEDDGAFDLGETLLVIERVTSAAIARAEGGAA